MKPRRTKVMLVTPPYHCGMVESAGVWMPLGLGYLAGSLRAAGYDPVIYDAMSLFHDLPDIGRTIEADRPDVVAVTAYTATVNAARDVLAARARSCPGGHYRDGRRPPHLHGRGGCWRGPRWTTSCEAKAKSRCPNCSTVWRPAGGPRIVAGVSYPRTGRQAVHTRDRSFIRDLDALPVAWDLLEWPTYHYRTKPGSRLAIVSWARGCTERCSFCSQQRFWRATWRPRSIDSIIAELRLLRDTYRRGHRGGGRRIPHSGRGALGDHPRPPHPGRSRPRDSCSRPAPTTSSATTSCWRSTGRPGMLHIYVGVESVRQDRLDGMRKNLKVEQSRRAIELLNQAGIITETSFLLGFPDETRADVQRTLELSFEYDPDLAFFLAITPWPYSDYYREVQDKVEVTDYSLYNLSNPIIRPGEMTREELSAELSRCFAQFYRHKMQNLAAMPPHKQQYLTAVAKLLRENSYLSSEVMAAMGHPGAGAVPAGRPDGAGLRVTPHTRTQCRRSGERRPMRRPLRRTPPASPRPLLPQADEPLSDLLVAAVLRLVVALVVRHGLEVADAAGLRAPWRGAPGRACHRCSSRRGCPADRGSWPTGR